MLKLFSVYLGGRAEKCNIELHDVVFVVSESISTAYPELIKKWFGITKRLHIDAYIELSHVDGHNIGVNKDKPKDNKKLFYVNFGAYKKNYFGEIHESEFYVASSKTEVLARAKKVLCVEGIEPHCDDNIIVDDMIEINQIDQYYLHFAPAKGHEINIISDYQRLDTPEILSSSQ